MPWHGMGGEELAELCMQMWVAASVEVEDVKATTANAADDVVVVVVVVVGKRLLKFFNHCSIILLSLDIHHSLA
jgi:ketosteroid isomerase-like protein